MPDQIIRDLPLIRRYARHNEAEDAQFRAYFKHHLPLPNAELDAVVRETTDRVWRQIDCVACANCCRTLQIIVDNKDIERLAARLGETPRQVARKYVRTDSDGARHLASAPCVFLGADGRCAVYEDRPQACRDFPYLHAPNVRSRSLMTMENVAMCPIVFNVWQALKARFRQRGRAATPNRKKNTTR